MKDSGELVSKALSGIRPPRTPIFDLFTNDAVIEHFAGRSLDGADDEAVCTDAVANGLDASRGRLRPNPEGKTWTDQVGNVLAASRWTTWVRKPAFSDVDQWVAFIEQDVNKLDAQPPPDEEVIADERAQQQAYNDKLRGTVFIHCTPSTAINAVLFGYHCGLETFSFLWADHRCLVKRWLAAIRRQQLLYVEKTAHRTTSPLAMIYSDIAFKNSLMFGKAMLAEFDFFGEVAQICDLCHEKGLKVIFHSDGYIMDILDSLVAAGVDGINPVEKAAGMDIYQIRRRHPQLTIVGGVDVTHMLRTAPPMEIRRETRRIINEVGAEGRLLIGSSTEVGNDIPLTNYLAFHDEATSE